MENQTASNIEQLIGTIHKLEAEASDGGPTVVAEDKQDFTRKLINGDLEESDIPEAMQRAFTRSLLAGVPFSHAFLLLGGKVSVVFQEPDGAEMPLYSRLGARLPASDLEGNNALVMLFFLREVVFREDGRTVSRSPLSPEECVEMEALNAAALSEALQLRFAETFRIGASIMRILPVLWLRFSGAWRFLIQNALPETF